MRDFLKKIIAAKEKRANELRQLITDAKTADEVRSLGAELDSVNAELTEARNKLAELPDEEPVPANAERRGLTPVASFKQSTGEKRDDSDPYGTMEYRMAFKAMVQRGTPIPANLVSRAAGDEGTTLTTELGAIIPTTIMNEFIKEVSKVYGQVYAKVRKLNIKGGVKFPISQLGANFSWITETTVSGKQKAGDVDTFIEFSYNIGEIRVAESLLAQVVSLDLFESEIVRIMLEAYVKAMDTAIIAGSGVGQPLGITVDPRVTNVVTMTAAQFADWKEWRKRLFAVVPLSKRGGGQFLFSAATVETNLLTMHDGNDRPLFREATDLSVPESGIAGNFYGRPVTLVEPELIKDFDTASAGDVVGVFWNPQDYAINTNLAFGMKRYFNEETNEWINKGLTIVDGKILDTSGCYLIKKA